MPAFALSKPFMDVGLFTNQGEAMRDFYSEEVGLEQTDVLDIEPGYQLYRYDASGSALKINALGESLERSTPGFRRILIAKAERSTPLELEDPDGMGVMLVPPGYEDVTQVGIVWTVRSLATAEAFAERAIGAEKLGTARYRVGETTLLFEEDPASPRMGALETVGFTYPTLHVRDVLGAQAAVTSSGFEEAIPPTPFGEVTTYSFVSEPFGNWIEVSQRADLAGSVAPDEGPVLEQAEIRANRRSP